jgi:hypothetical protein
MPWARIWRPRISSPRSSARAALSSILAEPLLAGDEIHRLPPQLDDGPLHLAREMAEGDFGHPHLSLPVLKERWGLHLGPTPGRGAKGVPTVTS